MRLAAGHTKAIAATFRKEQTAVLAAHRAGKDPALAVKVATWEAAIADVWLDVGERVYPATVAKLTAQKQAARLIALAQEIVRGRRPASRVARFIADAAEGITTTSRRRIHTVLREATTPAQLRQVTGGLARLYRTDFVTDRAQRVALDSVLRAASTFEHAAAMQVAASTGRTYLKFWITQGDAKVRPTHSTAQADNAGIPLDEDFKVGGALLRHPRDPAGPPSETFGCRCWSATRRQ